MSYYFMTFRFAFNVENSVATLSKLMTGDAATPFQYRILIPYLINLLFIHTKMILSIKHPIVLFHLIEFLAAFGFICASRYYFQLLIRKKIVSIIFSLVLFNSLIFNFILPRAIPIFYPSDIPSMFFFTLGLIFLYKQKWLFYYILFIIASFNRETTCFLTCIYFLTYIGKTKPKLFILNCFAQLIIWLSIKYFLVQMFVKNPGAGLFEEHHLSTNLSFLLHIDNYPFLFSSFGFMWIPVFYFFRLISDNFVKRSLFVVFPFISGMMIVGNIYELRIYGELFPVILSAFILIVIKLVSSDDK